MDKSTKAVRIKSSQKKTLRARRKSKGKVSDETLRRVSLNAFTSLGKEWEYFRNEDQQAVLEKFLKRVGKVGEIYLGNASKDKVVKNLHDFFGRLGKKHSWCDFEALAGCTSACLRPESPLLRASAPNRIKVGQI